MGRKYDLENVEETQFINEAGEYTVKVISVTQEVTGGNNPVEKVVFRTKDDLQISDEFVVTDKALWKMKLFTKALKLPTVTDTDDWIGRYVKIHVGVENYTRNDNTKGQKHVIKKYEPSTLTNTKGQDSFGEVPRNGDAFDGEAIPL
jgi:hypothetical protein